MTAKSVTALLLGSLLITCAVSAQPSPPDEQWFAPTSFSVRSSILLQRDFDAATLLVAEDGDVRIEISGVTNGQNYSGTLMVLSGQYMLARGIKLVPGAEIDAIDAPVLQAQLAMRLLARALPRGPQSVIATTNVNLSETREDLEIATQSASGGFPAPWGVTGSVKRQSPTKVSFSLSFTVSRSPQPMLLTGTWEKSSWSVFPDSTSVKEWRAFHLGPHESSANGGTIVDYGAKEIAGGFSTLGKLREYAKRKAGGA